MNRKLLEKLMLNVVDDVKKLAIICATILGIYFLTPAEQRWQLVHFLIAVAIGGSAWFLRSQSK